MIIDFYGDCCSQGNFEFRFLFLRVTQSSLRSQVLFDDATSSVRIKSKKAILAEVVVHFSKAV